MILEGAPDGPNKSRLKSITDERFDRKRSDLFFGLFVYTVRDMAHRRRDAETATVIARRKRNATVKRRRRARLSRIGLCVNCRTKHTAKRQKCDQCAARAAEHSRTVYHRRQRDGLCKCGKPTAQDFKQCAECRYRDRERRRPLTTTQTECVGCGRWIYGDERCCDD